MRIPKSQQVPHAAERPEPRAEPKTPWAQCPSHVCAGTAQSSAPKPCRPFVPIPALAPPPTWSRTPRLRPQPQLPVVESGRLTSSSFLSGPLMSAVTVPAARSRPLSLPLHRGGPRLDPFTASAACGPPRSPCGHSQPLSPPSYACLLTPRPLPCGSLCLGHPFSSGLLGQLLDSSAEATCPRQLPLSLVSSLRLRAAHCAGDRRASAGLACTGHAPRCSFQGRTVGPGPQAAVSKLCL